MLPMRGDSQNPILVRPPPRYRLETHTLTGAQGKGQHRPALCLGRANDDNSNSNKESKQEGAKGARD